MNRHDLKLVCVSIAATLVCTLSVNTVLADTPLKNSIKSYGVFKFDYDDSDNQDDIVIDSSDLVTLANEIDTAKNSIGVVGKNLDKLVTVFDKMDEQGKDGKLFGTQIDSTDAGVLKIENVFANGVGNATASKVLKDYTFTSQYGLNIPGTIESLQASTITPGTKDQTLKAGFYLKGAQTIKGDTNLKAENILSGKSIFGVNGSVIAEVNSSAHTVPTGKTVSTAANILKNTTAWNGTTWVDGSMTNKSNSTTAASTVTEDGSNAKIQIPASGYYDANNSYITVPVETLKKEVSALNSSTFNCIYPDNHWTSNSKTIQVKKNQTAIVLVPYSGRGADTSYTAGSEMQLIKAISPSVPYLTSSNDGGCVKAYIYKALNDSYITVTGSWWINLVIVF